MTNTAKTPTAFDEAAAAYFAGPTPANLAALTEAAKGLVYRFARLYGGGCRFDDLAQTGMEGLLKAVQTYDAERGAFVTWAGHCVINEIRKYVRAEASYYAPGSVYGLKNKIDRLVDDYFRLNGSDPPLSYIAKKLNIREDSVSRVMGAGLVEFSELEGGKIRSAYRQNFQLPIEDRIFLEQALKKLNDIQKKVIYLLFYRELSQDEAAKRLGISQKQVSRIKENSLKVMRGAPPPPGGGN